MLLPKWKHSAIVEYIKHAHSKVEGVPINAASTKSFVNLIALFSSTTTDTTTSPPHFGCFFIVVNMTILLLQNGEISKNIYSYIFLIIAIIDSLSGLSMDILGD